MEQPDGEFGYGRPRVKFTVPTLANGRVYVGTAGNSTGDGFSSAAGVPGELDVYGLRAQ